MPRGSKGEKRAADVIGAAVMVARIASEPHRARWHLRKLVTAKASELLAGEVDDAGHLMMMTAKQIKRSACQARCRPSASATPAV